MMRVTKILLTCGFVLAFAIVTAMGASGQKEDTLLWRTNENRVTAEISAMSVTRLLEEIAALTSWHIYLEPGTKHTVSTKFKDLPPGEALRLLLGDLSFALVPQKQAPSRLYVFRTTMQEATQLIKAAPKADPTAKPITNELIVTLKPGGNIDELARKYGAKVVGRIPGSNAYRLSFDSADAADAARAGLKGESTVDTVSNNFYMHQPEVSDYLAASSALGLDLKERKAGDCQNQIVGLIDTPIQSTGSSLDAFLLPSVTVADGTVKVGNTEPTHATGMFETILRGLSIKGNETSVKILPVDVYGNSATTTTFDVAHGIVEAANRGATVINLSLGSAGDSQFLRDLIKRVSDQGVILLAAAGNQPGTTPTYPAAYPQVLAVTAGTRDGSIDSYANSGDFVDLIAPGSSIVPFNNQAWLVSGTSASTAYASGLAAALYDCTSVTPAQVAAKLRTLLPVKK
jgi:hypothetical protein